MLNLFKTKINSSWGLHITDRHLRSVEISGDRKKGWHIERIGKVDLPLGLVENGLIKNPEILKNFFTQLKDKTFPSPQKSSVVIVNLAEEHIFSRVIQMPPMTKEEMDEAIQWEAESNIPLPIEKVYLSWEPLENAVDQKNSVLLTATPKNIIDDLTKTLAAAKLTPIAIEPESTALLRSLSQTQSAASFEAPLLIVNLREYCTHIIAFDSKVTALCTTSEHASQGFDAAIENTFKIKKEDAEKFRQRIGWNTNEELGRKLIEATASALSVLKKDIGGAMSFFNNKSGKDIKKILLTGEKRGKWNGFEKHLEKEIGVPVEWQADWNPSIWPTNCPYVTEEKEEYNIGVGLALRKLEEEI